MTGALVVGGSDGARLGKSLGILLGGGVGAAVVGASVVGDSVVGAGVVGSSASTAVASIDDSTVGMLVGAKVVKPSVSV